MDIQKIKTWRRKNITQPLIKIFAKQLPTLSETEQAALTAGTVSFDGDIFSGNPAWDKLTQLSAPKLTAEEQAFLDGPVETVCGMTDDWEVTTRWFDLPPAVWEFLKKNRFFGMIVPKKYDGLGFSAFAHAQVLVKLGTRGHTLAVTVGVPNSLGPAELLLHYGTETQKNYYLPRLARGEEIPCFALTGPEAGSDAGAIPDTGIVEKGFFEGKEVIGIRLNWDKRYITLAPIATLLGLAFKLYDPHHLLSDKTEYGITCALIPTHLPGISIGLRHYPLDCAFQNGPTQGKDVFIPVDYLIGGLKMAGHGWRMLVECLSAGRAITLPSSAVSGAKICTLATGAYAHIRRQFKVPIGQFEGIQEGLAKIAGFTYIADAGLRLTSHLIDQGAKPSVLSAIMKSHATEMGREVVRWTMDIHGGKGIALGPNNYLGRGYQGTPISITVEGANILTRNLMIFGQGAIRCHPFVLKELAALQLTDTEERLHQFDDVLWRHIGFTLKNVGRGFLLGITRSFGVRAPDNDVKRWYQRITRVSTLLAVCTDVALLLFGGHLKRREMLSARLGDVLSDAYLASSVLKHYQDQGSPREDRALVHWSCTYLLAHAENQVLGFIDNLPQRAWRIFLRLCLFPLGRHHNMPLDLHHKKLAAIAMRPSPTRDRLGHGLYLTDDGHHPVAFMEKTLIKIMAVEQYLDKHKKSSLASLIAAAENENLLTPEILQQVKEAESMRKEVIAVDSFKPEALAREAVKHVERREYVV